WRHEVDAILVGANTILNDDAELTVRLVDGKNPVRLIIDPNGKIPAGAKIFSASGKTVVFTKNPKPNRENIVFIELQKNVSVLKIVLKTCYDLQVQSVLVEGGAHTLQTFIDANI